MQKGSRQALNLTSVFQFLFVCLKKKKKSLQQQKMLRFNLGTNVNRFYGRCGPQPSASIISRNNNNNISMMVRHQSISSSNNHSTTSLLRNSQFYRSSSSSGGVVSSTTTPRLYSTSRTNFLTDLKNKVTGQKSKDVELQQLVYDKETVHYTGKLFGVSTDTLFFYAKMAAVGITVYLVLWTFFSGYQYLMSFSLATVGKMGFMAGFWTSMILATTAAQIKKRYTISPNAVYNQAIALVMKDAHVAEFLGQYPKTGDFRAYHATGGFKLPLLRRIRSGSYELADLLGTKQQKLQMMFILRAPGKEALVTCDVRKIHTRIFTSSYQFKSLAVHLQDDNPNNIETRVLIGRDEDVIYKGILKF